jgi:dUTP pyrophosphatase
MRCSFIPLDYALIVSKKLPVLLVAEPGLEPAYAQPGDAGADLRSAIDTVVPALGRTTIRTGVSIALPDGYVGLVHPRSGLSAKHGITVLNAPGTVDAGYRGEIAVTLYNSTNDDFAVSRGDRIAQLVIQAIEVAEFISVESLPGSHRGTAGFGSTGTK